MTRRRSRNIPEPITQLQQQLEQFRTTDPPRTKLPESLSQPAVLLAGQYGIWQTAKPLRLDYMGLKKRLAGSGGPRQRTLEEYVIEFESSQGAGMRIHWKGTAAPDWTRLLRIWRDLEG